MIRTVVAFLVGILACAGPVTANEIVIVPRGSDWRYLDDGSNQGTAWRAPGFVDATWPEDPAQLGYGDDDETTVIGFGGDPNNKHTTAYFRHAFDVPDPNAYTSLTLGLLRDDGAVVYLNGVEVMRSNMPGGVITYQTFASSTVAGTDEDIFNEVTLAPTLLATGPNVLAVEVHQRNLFSSDTSFDFELTGGTGGTCVTRGPYLQRATQTSMVVRWRTNVPTDSVLSIGSAPGALAVAATSGALLTEHELVATGLAPGASYAYAVGSSAQTLAGDDADHVFRTLPATGAAVPMRLWAIGDSGTADVNAANVYAAYTAHTGSTPTDVWLMLGDNAYNDGTDPQYQAAVFDMYAPLLHGTPIWPTLGNHDAFSADSPSESGVYYDIFTLPRAAEAGGLASGTEAYYSFDHGNVHFVCLDSDDTNRAPGGAMLTWLADDLNATMADWIIAYWHHPPYTKGVHDSDDNGDSGGRLRDMRENALPILEAAGVDLVLNGHCHNYERSFLLDGHYDTSDTLTAAMIMDGGDGRETGDGAYVKAPGITANTGAVYVVAGSSGKLQSGPLDHPAMYISLLELGSVVVDVNGLRLDAVFIDDAGTVRDSFTIDKGCAVAGDLDGDGSIGFADLSALLGAWGPCPACPEDLDQNGNVGFTDLNLLLAGWWGPC